MCERQILMKAFFAYLAYFAVHLISVPPERGSVTRSAFANPDSMEIHDGYLASTRLRPTESRSV